MAILWSVLFLAYKLSWTVFLLQLIFNTIFLVYCFFLLLFLCFLFLDQTLWVWVNDGENISSHHYNKKNMKHGRSLTKSSWRCSTSVFYIRLSQLRSIVVHRKQSVAPLGFSIDRFKIFFERIKLPNFGVKTPNLYVFLLNFPKNWLVREHSSKNWWVKPNPSNPC